MTKVLVTGGTGTLGRLLVPLLATDAQPVRVLTRKPPANASSNVRFVRGDLSTGAGLMEATHAVDVIVHCASSAARKTRQTDIEGTQRLLDAVKSSGGSPHLIYISIVGVDRHPYGYYRAKRATEEEIEAGGLPYTILRTTQWHELLAFLLGKLTKANLTFLPKGFSFQPLAASEAAARLADLVGSEPSGLLPDMGGPEVLSFEEIARAWAAAVGRDLRIVDFPYPGRAGAAFRAGVHLAPERALGRETWRSGVTKNLAPEAPG